MSESAELLALRKELILARSALYRLKIGGEVVALRESLSWARAGLSVAGSVPVRNLAFGLMLSGLGGGRLARFIALASRTLVVARLAVVAIGMLRGRPAGPPAATNPEGAWRS